MESEQRSPCQMSKSTRDVDGGWGWVVLSASFMNILISTGITCVSGIFQKVFLKEFQESVAFTAWVTGLFSSLTQLAGPLSGILVSATNVRTTVMVGGAFLALGLAASSFAKSMAFLFVTFGLCGGLGLGLLYTPSIVVVNFFFDRRRTVIMGVALSAGGIGIIGAPMLSHYLIDQFTWQAALLVLACLSAHTCVFGALMFPIHESRSRCGCLHHRSPRRWRRKDSDSVNEQIKVLEMVVLDKEKNVEGNVETSVKHDCKMKLSLDSLHSAQLEDRNTTLLKHDEHQTADVVNPLQRSLAHLQYEDTSHASIHNENTALSGEDERQKEETTPLVQNSVPDSLICSEAKITGTLNPEKITNIHQTTANASTDANSKVCEFKNLLNGSHFLDEETAGVSHSDSKIVSACGCILSLQGVGLESAVSAGSENVLNVKSESSREKISNLVIFKTFPFIMLCVSLFLSSSACGIFLIHLPAFCAQRGIDNQDVAFILAINGVGLFLSRILLGGLGHDKKVDQLAVFFSLHAISSFNLTMLSFADNVASVAAILMLMGLYHGGTYTLLSSITVSLVGLPRLAFAFGVEMISAGFGYLVAPPLAGLIVDKTGSYNNSIYLAGFLLFLSAIAVAFMTCRQKPGRSLTSTQFTSHFTRECSRVEETGKKPNTK